MKYWNCSIEVLGSVIDRLGEEEYSSNMFSTEVRTVRVAVWRKPYGGEDEVQRNTAESVWCRGEEMGYGGGKSKFPYGVIKKSRMG